MLPNKHFTTKYEQNHHIKKDRMMPGEKFHFAENAKIA